MIIKKESRIARKACFASMAGDVMMAKSSLRRIASICLAIMIVFSGFALPANADAGADGTTEGSSIGLKASSTAPVIKLTEVPKYGEKSTFKGIVYTEDGSSFNTDEYRISLYLQIYEGGQYWVKPYYDETYANVNKDGSFSIKYATGGTDENAVAIHIMLIPSSYTPASDFYSTRAAALDYVKVTRSADGSVTIDPDREGPSSGGGESGDPADTKVKKVSNIKVSKKKLAVDVGLYITGAPGGKLTKKTIKKQLKAVKKFSNTVRFYGAAGQLTKAYKIAHDMGFKVIGSAYLSKDKAANEKEIAALIKVCKKGYVSVACVGNETLLNGYLTPDELNAYINEVRTALSGSAKTKKIPVTTSDDANAMISSRSVADNCDLLMVNAYPYWGGVAIGEAAKAFDATIAGVRSAYPTKEIIVSETGWPTAGGSKGAAKASGANARKYFNAIRKWSLKNDIVVLWFDAADEPWKAKDEGAVGAHWGLMTKKCKLKSCYKKATFFKSK